MQYEYLFTHSMSTDGNGKSMHFIPGVSRVWSTSKTQASIHWVIEELPPPLLSLLNILKNLPLSVRINIRGRFSFCLVNQQSLLNYAFTCTHKDLIAWRITRNQHFCIRSETTGTLLLKDFKLDFFFFLFCVQAWAIEAISIQNQGRAKKWKSRNKVPSHNHSANPYLQKGNLGTLRTAVNHWFVCSRAYRMVCI